MAPAQLITRDGFGYLQAWSLERDAWRTYRLDRISAVHPTPEPVGNIGEPPVFGPGWLEQRPDAAEVTLTLDPEAAWIAEYHPIRALRHRPGAIEIDLLVADPAWLRSLLLRLGRAVRAVVPDGPPGYVGRETVVDAASPLRRKRLPAGVSVRDAPADRAAVAQILDEPQQVDVLGRFGAYTFVRLNDRRTGWIQ